MWLNVAQNYVINTHSMGGVCTDAVEYDRGERFVVYSFEEHNGTQTLSANTYYSNYSGQRLFVGKYVHTWQSSTLTPTIGQNGFDFTISPENSAWKIACDLVAYSD